MCIPGIMNSLNFLTPKHKRVIMNTLKDLEEQTRLAVIEYLSNMDKVTLEFAIRSDNLDNLEWSKSKGSINLNSYLYRIVPKKLWYMVALTYDGENYYTMSVTTDIQQSNIGSRDDFIKWLTPDKVYYTVENNT